MTKIDKAGQQFLYLKYIFYSSKSPCKTNMNHGSTLHKSEQMNNTTFQTPKLFHIQQPRVLQNPSLVTLT